MIGERHFEHVMVDLETLGTVPGCSIISIGAVAFDPVTSALGPEFYVTINRENCLSAGLFEDPNTIDWWSKQSESAKTLLNDTITGGERLEDALLMFKEYLSQFGFGCIKVWGNGADFDNAMLAVCYERVGLDLPWRFYNNRCYRTLKNVLPGAKFIRQGTYHNALDDAKSQAAHACELFKVYHAR